MPLGRAFPGGAFPPHRAGRELHKSVLMVNMSGHNVVVGCPDVEPPPVCTAPPSEPSGTSGMACQRGCFQGWIQKNITNAVGCC
jgi:hypothetical protein